MGRESTVRDDASDAELLAACAEDPEAFGAFYRRHVAAVLAYLHARLGRTDLAADICSETFARALERAALFDPRRGHARAWLFTIGSSILVDSVRRGRVEDRARRRLGMPPRTLTDGDIERMEELIDVRRGPDPHRLVADLPEEQRAALLARIVEERSYAEIAAELEVSEAVVRQRVSRGLAAMRGRLKAEGS